jgi:FKBP-type peptidyl-prolyl cis-trans isomerase FklB
MKRILLPAAILSLGFAATAQKKTTTKAPPKVVTSTKPLKSRQDSLSYAFGISLGTYLKGQDISTINYTLLNKAIEQVLKGQATYMDANTANMCMTQMGAEKQKKKGDAERAAGVKFLAENKKKAGIHTTASGLQYEIIAAGTGPIPTAKDTISAHYRGTLLNGKEFDNSYQRGQPLTIPVSGVIKGWTEALQLMPVGSKWKLYIPSELAYGEYGAGQDIPSGATLVFEVELIDIVNKK